MKSEKLRLPRHPVLRDFPANHTKITFNVDGKLVEARQGDILAFVLWSKGILKLGHNHVDSACRGIYCGIGHCYECCVTVDGIEDVRSCLTLVRNGMEVLISQVNSNWEKDDDR